jgi:hypothetical protein
MPQRLKAGIFCDLNVRAEALTYRHPSIPVSFWADFEALLLKGRDAIQIKIEGLFRSAEQPFDFVVRIAVRSRTSHSAG